VKCDFQFELHGRQEFYFTDMGIGQIHPNASNALKMGATDSAEMSVTFYQATRCHLTEDPCHHL